MPLQSSLYALAVDRPGAAPIDPPIVFGVILAALAVVAVWLLMSGDSGPDGLLRRGARLAMAGRYTEAEKCYRKALGDDSKLAPLVRGRLMVCLGESLMDMDRHDESRQYLEAALVMDDPRGECRASLADLLLLRGGDPRRALNLAEEAIEACKDELGDLPSGEGIGERLASFVRAGQWARRAWALALLERPSDSQECVDYALKLVAPVLAGLGASGNYKVPATTAASLCLAGVHWRAAEALLAMGRTGPAREHFQIASDLDPQGKCGARSRQHLERLGPAAG
ncbi:MAG TPA: tetratricopeptide repeat protein [Bryobacteraceae bacterium]|nr:tetratricopeptide repeat protein [Bryobacteraceae bacterium]